MGSLVLHLSLVSLDSDGLGASFDFQSPRLDLSLFTSAALLGALDSDGDWLAGSLASGDSVSVDSDLALNNNLSSLFSDLDEFGSDLLAVARFVSDDDLSGLLASLELVFEDDNLLLNLGLLLSSDGELDLLGSLDLAFPFLNSCSAAGTWLLDLLDSDGDLTSSLASSDSVVVDSDLSSGFDDSFLSSVDSHSVLKSFAAASLDGSFSHNNLSSFGASFLVDSLGSDNNSVGLSDSSLFNSSNSVLVNSVLLLDSLASAFLVLDDDVLSGLRADFDSSSPSSELVLILSDSERLVFCLNFLVLVSQSGILSSPSVNLCLCASTRLLVDSDDLASLCTSDNSVLQNEFLSLSFDEPSSDLNSPESLSDFFAATGLSSDDDFLSSFADFSSVVPDLVLLVDRFYLLSGLNSSDPVILNSGFNQGGSPFLDLLLGARTRLVVDNYLSSLFANSESLSVDEHSIVDSVCSNLEGDSVGSSSISNKGMPPLSDL